MPNAQEIITNEILKQLENDVVPWRKEFNTLCGLPKNIVSNKEYQGINVLMLLCQTYSSPYWMTFKQAGELGGKIKKGEAATKVVFWKILKKEEKEKEKSYPMMRYYNVWNLEQTEGVKLPKHVEAKKVQNEDVTPIEACENILKAFKDCPPVTFGKSPKYIPAVDKIEMPHPEDFIDMANYYNVFFHEMAHSTKHLSRLNRESLGLSYAEEEIVAELTAAFLAATAGIGGIGTDVFKNGVSYIKGWSQRTAKDIHNDLKSNPRLIIRAASLAQKASEYIQGITELTKIIEESEAA